MCSFILGNLNNEFRVCTRIADMVGFVVCFGSMVLSVKNMFPRMRSKEDPWYSAQQTICLFVLVLRMSMNISFHLIVIYLSNRQVCGSNEK